MFSNRGNRGLLLRGSFSQGLVVGHLEREKRNETMKDEEKKK